MQAFGARGISPTWTSSAKDMVGCALGPARLGFTSGFGILNEVYYSRVDIPQIGDPGFIVADGRGFWAEVKRQNAYRAHAARGRAGARDRAFARALRAAPARRARSPVLRAARAASGRYRRGQPCRGRLASRTQGAGQALVVYLPQAAVVHAGFDGWQRVRDVEAVAAGFGLYAAELPTAGLVPGQSVQFTLYWPERGTWEGRDYQVGVIEGDPE